jgi:hypothetical protein
MRGQLLTEASVGAEAEGQVGAGLPVEVQGVRIRVHGRVAVAGLDDRARPRLAGRVGDGHAHIPTDYSGVGTVIRGMGDRIVAAGIIPQPVTIVRGTIG